jgi:tetratricopeptide (TPR) repeat protein
VGGFYGFYGGFSPMLAMGPFGFMPPMGWMAPPPIVDRGPLLPPPPAGLVAPRRNRNRAGVKSSDAVRSGQLTTLGDRLFRAGNFKKAEERYVQAIRAAPDLALPHVRRAQVAMVRGQYGAAADQLREAETAQPGWILSAPDIQALYGEPADFASNVGRLETYLQANPDDRDAWLVLGAEWFLSGRTNKAADVFKRLNDPNRKPDVALAAFLDASNQAGLKPARPIEADDPIQ